VLACEGPDSFVLSAAVLQQCNAAGRARGVWPGREGRALRHAARKRIQSGARVTSEHCKSLNRGAAPSVCARRAASRAQRLQGSQSKHCRQLNTGMFARVMQHCKQHYLQQSIGALHVGSLLQLLVLLLLLLLLQHQSVQTRRRAHRQHMRVATCCDMRATSSRSCAFSSCNLWYAS